MTEFTWALDNGVSNESLCYRSNSDPSGDYLEKCDCPIECQTHEYTWVHTFGDHTEAQFKNQTRFRIFYDEMRETVIGEEIKVKLTDLVSTIGGILVNMRIHICYFDFFSDYLDS